MGSTLSCGLQCGSTDAHFITEEGRNETSLVPHNPPIKVSFAHQAGGELIENTPKDLITYDGCLVSEPKESKVQSTIQNFGDTGG